MIPKGYVSGTDFHQLTGAEARAFVIFELKESVRHRDDIRRIQEDVRNVCRVHGIEGVALNALYTEAYGVKQGEGKMKDGTKIVREFEVKHDALLRLRETLTKFLRVIEEEVEFSMEEYKNLEEEMK